MRPILFLLGLFAGSASVNPAFTDSKFSPKSPLELLRYLKEHCCEAVTVAPMPAGWITQKDVRKLETFLRDESPAAPVYNPFSSKLCRGCPAILARVSEDLRRNHFSQRM